MDCNLFGELQTSLRQTKKNSKWLHCQSLILKPFSTSMIMQITNLNFSLYKVPLKCFSKSYCRVVAMTKSILTLALPLQRVLCFYSSDRIKEVCKMTFKRGTFGFPRDKSRNFHNTGGHENAE